MAPLGQNPNFLKLLKKNSFEFIVTLSSVYFAAYFVCKFNETCLLGR